MPTRWPSPSWAPGVVLGSATPAAAAVPAVVTPRPQDEFASVVLRVTAVAPGGVVVIDRGSRDGVQLGDTVRLMPRGGQVLTGTIGQLDERTAVVDLATITATVGVGTRGEVLVPFARLEALAAEREAERAKQVPDVPPVVPPPVQPNQPTQPQAEGAPTAQGDKWQNQDEEYQEGMPLLAKVKPVRPSERPRNVTGRMYVISDLTDTRASGFLDSYFRTGVDLVYENPFGRGGGLRFGTEINYQTELNRRKGWDLLVRRFSYYNGGNRFDESRWEFGRFLQRGMPEFGILDGVEWGKRRANGDTYGVSLGAMPELNLDHESFDDFQVATYYNWTADEQEQFTFGAGYQKTVHNGDSDRDLLVTKFRYLPFDSWNVNGTAWIDFYTGGDQLETSFAEVTQAVASVSRMWDNGSGVDLNYQRVAYPELKRNEFDPALITDIFDHHNDRVGLDTWLWVTDRQQLHARGGAWVDEDDSGGDFQFGFDYRDLIFDQSSTDLTVYGTQGKFSTVIGGRALLGKNTAAGRWDLLYDFSVHRQTGFSNNIDDIVQHRLRASSSWFTTSGWSLSLWAQVYAYDEATDWGTGVYLQKVF